MRVLGVDPGLTRCGVGVVDSLPGRRARMVAVGVIRSDADLSTDLRLLRIAEGLDRWLDEHVPDVVAVERVFAQHNVGTVMGTAQAAGLAMVAAARRGVPVALHTPSEVKAAVTGSGRADALAVCHLWRPAGALQGGDRHELTPAQRAWAAAEQAAKQRPRR